MELKKIVMWALTYKCNMNCEYCYLKNVKNLDSDIKSDDYIKIAKKICNDNQWKPDAIWLTGGEPTLKECLPEIIEIFEMANIKVVLDTNGMITDDKAKIILEKKPRGIVISLDTVLEEGMSQRGDNGKILDRIKFFADNKKKDTILGTAVVLNKESIGTLYEYAEKMSSLGVQYLSLNPYHGSNVEKISSEFLKNEVEKIKKKNCIKLPSEDYLHMVYHFYDNIEEKELKCPAFYDYYFISPWGYIYPCSNEFWQETKNRYGFNALDSHSIYDSIMRFRNLITNFPRSNRSECYGARCIGCWKLYYDTIFTEKI